MFWNRRRSSEGNAWRARARARQREREAAEAEALRGDLKLLLAGLAVGKDSGPERAGDGAARRPPPLPAAGSGSNASRCLDGGVAGATPYPE